MTRDEIDAVLDRVRTWPLSRQEDAARTLIQLEQHGMALYELSLEEERDLDEAEASGVATGDEVRAAFARFSRHAP